MLPQAPAQMLYFLLYQHQIGKAYDSRRKSDIYDIKMALEEYEKDHNCYPDFVSCEGEYADDLQPYLPVIPCDPQTKTSYVYYPDPSSSSCHKWYWIFSNLSNDSDPKIDELGCTNGCGPTSDEAVYDYYDESPNAPDPFKGSEASSGLYGCFSGECLPIEEGQCSPNYSDENCLNKCRNDEGEPQYECQ